MTNRTDFPDNERFECKVCHYVYDPVEGDAISNIDPGMAFSKLPAFWTCPICGAEKSSFFACPKEERETNAKNG